MTLQKIKRGGFSLAILLLLVVLARVNLTHAQQNCSISYDDLIGHDGRQDLAVIHCFFAGDDNDVVYVYDRNGDMQPTGDWSTSTDFTDDLWMFDAYGDGRVNLIIDFHLDGSTLVADLYDDQTGDQQVSFVIEDGHPRITEKQFWTVRVSAPEGWWQRDQLVNFNLNIEVDGPVNAMASYAPFLDRAKTDGVVDFHIQVRDRDGSGQPDYDLRWERDAFPTSLGLRRLNLMVSESNHQIPLENPTFWPYLGQNRYGLLQSYNSFFPPIQIEWKKARLLFISEFVASRGGEDNWFVYSLPPYEPGKLYKGNFENPFAYYDMANDDDGRPELLVRTEGYAADDTYYPLSNFPVTSSRYCWDQTNDDVWDYCFNSVGRVSLMDTPVEIDQNLSLLTVPYADLPMRVITQEWDAVTFVTQYEEEFESSEGIYVGAVPRYIRDSYMTGIIDALPPKAAFRDDNGQLIPLPGQMSEEVAIKPGLYFGLYISPVDHRLHLLNAQSGQWNINGSDIIDYANLNLDAYLDQWRFYTGGSFLGEMNAASGYFVVTDGSEVLIKQTPSFEPSLVELTPPKDYDSWQELAHYLDQYQSAIPPQDYKQMIAQFPGDEWQITGAAFHDFRPLDDGFRFVLDLQPDFQSSGAAALSLDHLEAGSYIVTYDVRAGFSIESTIPAQLLMTDLSIYPEPLIELSPNVLTLTVQNVGLEDAHTVAFSLYTQRDGGEPRLVDDSQLKVYVPGFETKGTEVTLGVEIPGGDSYQVDLHWTSDLAGSWYIWVEANDVVLPGSEQVLTVHPAAKPDTNWSLGLAGVGHEHWLLLLIVSLLTAGVLLGFLLLRQGSKEVSS